MTPVRRDARSGSQADDPERRAERPSGIASRRVGPYQLEATLGRGGFGTVHRALDTRSGERVALKILHRAIASEPELLRRFLNEARTTSQADSPHVVRVIDAHEDLDGFACIAFELLQGETLDACLRREGALPPNEAVDLAVQILDGLEVAHERGVIHRDLKPANLFLVHDGMRTRCVKILDFGIGRLASANGTQLTATGTSLGSPYYMAPEQLFDSARADARADVYGVAVCLYRMLSGTLPHGDGPVPVWMAFAAQGRIAPLVTSPYGALPESLVEAVALGLSPRADARWQNATAFSSALLDSLPGASAPTRVSYEPAAVLRAPVPAPSGFAGSSPATEADRDPHDVRVQPYAGRSGRHAAIAFEAVDEEVVRAPLPPVPPFAPAQLPRPIARARPAPSWRAQDEGARPTPAEASPSRTLLIAALVACVVLTLALLVGGIGVAFVVGELVGQHEAPRAP